MLDPDKLIVLDGPTEVHFEPDTHDKRDAGSRTVERLAVTSYTEGFWLPPENDRPAHRVITDAGRVYVPSEEIRYIVDLTGDDFRPEGKERPGTPVFLIEGNPDE